jgi:hypothetical protein
MDLATSWAFIAVVLDDRYSNAPWRPTRWTPRSVRVYGGQPRGRRRRLDNERAHVRGIIREHLARLSPRERADLTMIERERLYRQGPYGRR